MDEELNQEQPLTKRERKRLAQQQKQEERERGESFSKIRKFAIWILILGALAVGVWWLSKDSSEPLPGEEVADLGREHTTDIAGITYNSNPPTSGTHFPIWAKKGVYDRVLSDGYLIHSLEHGYVVISYDCTKLVISHQSSVIGYAYAHDEPTEEATDSGELLKHMKVQPSGDMSWFTPDNPPEIEVELPEEFNSGNCSDLVNKLSVFANDWQRVIVVPRPGMDTQIALTAWTRIDKLANFDEARIEKFIKSFHNMGPEKTVE
jgi:hypothetical protein